MTNFISWAEKNRTLTLFLIFLLSVTVRILTAEYLDLGGDNSQRWIQAHRIAEGLGVTHWNNHSMRWTIVLPLAGLIKLFGPNPVLTYVQPFFYASITAVVICLIGERMHSLKLGISAACLTILYPQMSQTGSQIWPGVFEMAFIAIMLWCILCWIDTRSKHFLILAGVAFFLGWGARVTILYAYPGAVLLIWLATKDLKSVILFTAVAAGLCFAEWGWFWLDSGNPLGRIGLLSSTRGGDPALLVSWTDYLLSIKQLVKLKGLLPVMLLTLAASVYALRNQDPRWRGIALFYLIFLFLTFYMISGISPLKFANPYGARNWPACAPFGFLMLLWCLFNLQKLHARIAVGLITILFVAFTAFSIKKIPPTLSVLQMSRDYTLLTPVTAANMPILMRYEPWQPNFIEKVIIDTFTGKKKRKERSDSDMAVDMWRNQQRLTSLFVTDVRKLDTWRHTQSTRLEKYVYIFRPPGAPEDIQPTVESVFGRKLHQVRTLHAQ